MKGAAEGRSGKRVARSNDEPLVSAKGDAHEPRAGEHGPRNARVDPVQAARTGERVGDVQRAARVEREALRTAEAFRHRLDTAGGGIDATDQSRSATASAPSHRASHPGRNARWNAATLGGSVATTAASPVVTLARKMVPERSPRKRAVGGEGEAARDPDVRDDERGGAVVGHP